MESPASAGSCTRNPRARWRILSKMRSAAGCRSLYVQDVSGFMVGVEAEAEGIIRAGAEMVETMACATVPKIVLTINHASGAGYYAMAGQGFDPNFTFSWPTARIGVMEGDSAVQAVYGPELTSLKEAGKPVPPDLEKGSSRRGRLRALARCEVRGGSRALRCCHRSAGYEAYPGIRVRGGLHTRIHGACARTDAWRPA